MISGCASTKMSVYKDPGFINTKYSSLVVNINLQSYKNKKYFEEQVCNKLLKYEVDCTKGIDVFLPTRQYTNKEWVEEFLKSNAEGLLIIQLIDSYTTQSYVPQTTVSSGSATYYGNVTSYNQTTNTYGGYVISKPVENYKVSLIDAVSGKTAFVATSTTKGNAFAGSPAIADSLASELVNQLKKAGFIGAADGKQRCRKRLNDQSSGARYKNPADLFCID